MKIAHEVLPDKVRVIQSLDKGCTEWYPGQPLPGEVGQGAREAMVRVRVTGVREAGEREAREREAGYRGAVHVVVDRSHMGVEDVQVHRPYERRSVRPRVMPPPGVEENWLRSSRM
ncbi:hypothetical protein Hdeb2414_s0008g00284471 [Helianthus debilis subsp. tardiflorus]